MRENSLERPERAPDWPSYATEVRSRHQYRLIDLKLDVDWAAGAFVDTDVTPFPPCRSAVNVVAVPDGRAAGATSGTASIRILRTPAAETSRIPEREEREGRKGKGPLCARRQARSGGMHEIDASTVWDGSCVRATDVLA